ncbi:MAG: FKBP-type peptidyl-prolyl cis-trans isomerase [Bacteroidales bacterium]|nr:FKBP-type peptidyl-prolyl cis-trans isomerase [Bacteroidales bacterium]
MNKLSYALGMMIAQNLVQMGATEIDFTDFAAGVKDSMQMNKPQITFEEASSLLNEFFEKAEAEAKEKDAAMAAAFKQEGEAWLAENAKADGVNVLASGLQYKVVKEGNGRKPGAADKVRCHYEGKLTNGMKFDSSYDRNEPAVFGVNQVIAGWTEALQLMSEGSEWELYIPYQLAYGEAGAQGAIPPCAALIFRVELIEVL